MAYDLRLILLAAAQAAIPVVIGSCGTSGTDSGVDWVYDIAAEVAAAEGLALRVARIYSEQDPASLLRRLKAGRIRPLPPAGPLDAGALQRCSHVVGVLGHEPIIDALEGGADLVLAGRASDTALIAAVPLWRGLPAGPAWHGAKISECGGLCTTRPSGSGVLVTFDAGGFTVEPLDPDASCTPRTVAAHMLYENRDPFMKREPGGTLEARRAVYTPVDDRRVRVEGSRFESAEQYTTKLEGAAPAGFRTTAIVGIREPGARSWWPCTARCGGPRDCAAPGRTSPSSTRQLSSPRCSRRGSPARMTSTDTRRTTAAKSATTRSCSPCSMRSPPDGISTYPASTWPVTPAAASSPPACCCSIPIGWPG